MNKLNFSREVFLKKKKAALTKIHSFREKFIYLKKRETADLEKARKIFEELSKKCRWWSASGELP